MKVNCWNEYDKLKTIILGSVYDIDNVPSIYQGKDQESFVKINEQTHYELLEFQKTLEQLGITVLRPSQPKTYNQATDSWQGPLINMRDFHLAYGNLFFLTYGSYTNRRYQHFWLEDIVNNLIDQDNLVVSANEFNFYFREEFLQNTGYEDHFYKTYKENYKGKNLYHTACLLKHNKKAFASKIAGTDTGTKFIKNWLSTIGVEYIELDYVGHIDGAHSILNDNLLLSPSANNVLAPFFKDVAIVPMSDKHFNWTEDEEFAKKVSNPTGWLYECQGYFQQFCAEANALSIDPETVCLSFYDKDCYNQLKNKGVTAIYIPWKNRHFWGGGLHCITLDIERQHA